MASGRCDKRYRPAGGDSTEDDGEIQRSRGAGDCTDDRNKRCRIAPIPAAGDDDDDRESGSGDYMYEDDDCDDQEAEKAKDDASACEEEQSYIVLTEDDVRARQGADTAKVAEVLSIPAGFAAVLLRHFKWRSGQVQEEWFSDDRRIRDAVGLPVDGVPVPTAISPWPLVCGICFDRYPAGRMRSAGCSHYYCGGCWRGYVGAAVGDGPRCLSLRCPEPSCSAAVVGDLVDAVAGGADRDRYARFALRSYVEESGGRIRWCPGPGCSRAVEFTGCDGGAADVFCACRHGFCWSCGEEAHRPVSCRTVRQWLDKNRSDSATADWVLVNAKHCPKCRQPIEKNQGCNHMRCRCGHHFCWLCLQPAGPEARGHYACDGYRERPAIRADAGGKAETEEEQKRRQAAKASLDRYLYHYERWATNHTSLQKVFRDMAALERSELERMAEAADLPATELAFLTEAYREIAGGRRVLRWAHAYGYYLDPERDAAKRGLFDYLQKRANSWLERLHACAELERKELFGAKAEAAAVDAATFKAYREKLANLTRVTGTFLGNLVKAFENDLPEVASQRAGAS